MRRELKIGIFMGGALVLLAVFIFIIGDLAMVFRKPGYPIYASFDSASGLERNAVVKMAGVKVGYVAEIGLDGRKARLKLVVASDIRIPGGSKILIATLGLLGEKYVEIMPGESDRSLSAGESLEGAKTVSFDQLGELVVSVGNEVKDMGRTLRGLIDGDTQTRLKGLIDNVSSFSEEISEFLAANKPGLDSGIRDFSKAAQNLDRRMEEIGGEMGKTTAILRSMVEENRETVKADLDKIKDLATRLEESASLLNDILKKIDRGEGTVGKLVQDPGLYSEARSAIQDIKRFSAPVSGMKASADARADYLDKAGKMRGALTFNLWSADGRNFQSQIVRDPREKRFTYSLQGGQRFGGFVPRAGLIESTFGAGLDFYAWDDRVALMFDAFDINRSAGPRLRLSARYSLHKYFHLAAGWDDFGLDSKRQFFVGLGVGR